MSTSSNLFTRAACFLSAILAIPFAAAQDTAPPGNHPIWRSMGGMPGTNGAVHCSVVDASGNLYVGGSFTVAGNARSQSIAKWDGTKWTSISPPMTYGGTVHAMAIDAQGNLYAGGSFRDIGGIPASRIAKWDGSKWHAMGTNQDFNGPVKAIAIAQNGHVYVGGTFVQAGSTTVNNVARWDGSQWHALGTGLIDSSPSVNALAFDASGNLFATGKFRWTGDSQPIGPHVAKWDGSAWSSLGTGLSGSSPPEGKALQIDSDGNLIVAGIFKSAGGIQVNNIARWNGTAWSAFGNGLTETGQGVLALGLNAQGEVLAAKSDIVGGLLHNDVVRWNGSAWVNVMPHPAIQGYIRTFQILSNGDYILGGDFKKLGLGSDTFHANHLTRWDGTRFHRFGNGPNGKIRAAKFAANDDLIVGGEFTTIGDIEASGIARFDGSQWWPMGSGVDGELHSLATGPNGEVFAGGKFNTAGGVASKGIARWDGSQWVSMDGGLTLTSTPNDTNVKTMALRPSDGALFVGGWFAQSVSGVPLSGIARWQNGAWHDLGGGARSADGTQPANGDVRSLVIDGQGNLFAGGAFLRMGTTSTNTDYIARWNGTQWSSVGPTNVLLRPFGQGLAIECVALSHGGVLHVGYRKTLTDSHSLTRLVSNVWQEIGNGFSGTPRSILFDDRGGIYAGGVITLTGPHPRHVIRGITFWDGTRWVSLGNEGLGMGLASPDVMAIARDSRGNLVLAGDFLGSSDGVVSPFLIRTRTDDYGLWSVLGSLPPDRLAPLDRNGPLGLQNLTAYAMGLDPLQADAADMPGFSLEKPSATAALSTLTDGPIAMDDTLTTNETPTIKFKYRRSRSAVGIETRVMASPDLVTWQPADILSTEVIEQHPEWERIEVTVPAEVDVNFLRLAIDFADRF